MKIHRLFASVFFSALVASGSGQEPPPPPPKMPAMEALDKNRDHIFDKEEIETATASLLTLDKNGDGRLTIEELRPAPPTNDSGASGEDETLSAVERRRLERERQREERRSRYAQGSGASAQGEFAGPPPKMPVMEALDKDRDHIFDKNEIESATASLLKLDKNKDGQLTEDEMRPANSDQRPGRTQEPPPDR